MSTRRIAGRPRTECERLVKVAIRTSDRDRLRRLALADGRSIVEYVSRVVRGLTGELPENKAAG